MITILFFVVMVGVFLKLIFFAARGAWGLMKILFSLIILPFMLIGLVVKGLIAFAFPILIIFGIYALLHENGTA